jgi:Tol biopolymer transport system component
LADANSANFAPDGNIVFASIMSGNSEIWSIKPDGSNQRQLTSDPADDRAPLVSADNNFVFFTSNRTGEAEIWRINLDGSNQTQITNKQGGYPISISADGRWLYYLHALQRQLWRVSTNGGDEQLVFDKRASRFVISPDGLLAAYADGQGHKTVFTILSIPDGRTVKSLSVPDLKAQFFPFVWLADRRGLAYITENRDSEKTLWSKGLDDLTPRKITSLGVEEITQSGLAVSPDGKNFVVVSGGWRHDAILIHGLK